MGIRIHKMIGYGLTDLKPDDPRVNPKGILKNWDVDESGSYGSGVPDFDSIDDFLGWYALHYPKSFELKMLQGMRSGAIKTRINWSLSGPRTAFEWPTEYEGPHVLCVRGLTNSEWYRHDNMIDWVEETYLTLTNETLASRVKVLRDGIFPYNSTFMDSRTGMQVDTQEACLYKRATYGADVDVIADDFLESLSRKLGFKDHYEVEKYMAPLVPETIRALCEWGQAFTDDAVVNQFRPMYFSWWE